MPSSLMWMLMACRPRDQPADRVFTGVTHRNHVVVDVPIGDGRRCLVDTGASYSASAHGVERLEHEGRHVVLEHDPVAVALLNQAGFEPPLDCVLGLDALQLAPTAAIDFAGRLTLGRAARGAHAVDLKGSLPVADVEVAGKAVQMLLDTGATTSALRPELFDRVATQTGEVRAGYQGPEGVITEGRVDIRFGGEARDRVVRADVPGLRRFERQLGTPVSGLVGADLLALHERIVFDWEAQHVWLGRPHATR